MSYGIFVHDPDGDSGDGVIVGDFGTAAEADRKADQIRIASRVDGEELVEAIVLPIRRPGTAVTSVIRDVLVD